MEWMDGARRAGGFVWLGIGVVTQLVAVLAFGVPLGAVTAALCVAVAALGLLMALAPRLALTRWAGLVVSILLGADLLAAVADRFGLLGAAGEPGVSWGDWDAFTTYTGTLMPFLPLWLVVVAAVAATAVEVVLGVLLVLGAQRRWVGKIAAGLFAIYLVAMLVSLGAGPMMRYALPMLIAGALLVSARHPVRQGPARQARERRRERSGRPAALTSDGDSLLRG